MYNDGYVPQGWQCPKCKRIYSPELPTCIFCNNDRQEVQLQKCPFCEALIVRREDNYGYCPNCGRKVKWDE